MNALNGLASPPFSIYSIDTDPVCVPVKDKSIATHDTDIWAAFKSGNEWAFELMFKEHYNLLLNYGLKFSNNEEDVKDYIQQLFSGLWESRERLGKNNSIKSYLLASLRRMIHRGSTRSKLRFLDLGSVAPSFHLDLSVENKFLENQREKEQVSYLSKLVERLPKRQKEAVYLKYYGEHDFSEIAEVMGISRRVAYKLVYKALDNLSRRIGSKEKALELFLSI